METHKDTTDILRQYKGCLKYYVGYYKREKIEKLQCITGEVRLYDDGRYIMNCNQYRYLSTNYGDTYDIIKAKDILRKMTEHKKLSYEDWFTEHMLFLYGGQYDDPDTDYEYVLKEYIYPENYDVEGVLISYIQYAFGCSFEKAMRFMPCESEY